MYIYTDTHTCMSSGRRHNLVQGALSYEKPCYACISMYIIYIHTCIHTYIQAGDTISQKELGWRSLVVKGVD